jgi:hypothetical protein
MLADARADHEALRQEIEEAVRTRRRSASRPSLRDNFSGEHDQARADEEIPENVDLRFLAEQQTRILRELAHMRQDDRLATLRLRRYPLI